MRNKKSRFIYMIVLGMLISLVIHSLVPFNHPYHFYLYDVFCSVAITILIWEGSLRIDSYLNKKLPWVEKTAQRIVTQFLITLVFSSVFIYFPILSFNHFVCVLPANEEFILLVFAIIIGVLVSFTVLSIEISSQFFTQWKKSLVQVEKYKAESIQAQFQNLKDQVNPHFLFNNLSVLSSLVYKDQDKAVDFINQLSKVYRYVLENQENELVSLEKELLFIESYLYLLQIRFDTNLRVSMEISEDLKCRFIPPMTLQLLLENCIKHNEVSEEKPLSICILADPDYLSIRNNLQERKTREESSGKGLKNIMHRIAYFTKKEVLVLKDEKYFEVKIPLLILEK